MDDKVDFNEGKFMSENKVAKGASDLINWFANSQKFIKGGSKTFLVGLNIEGNRNVGKYDKYDLMFAIYHEVEAHVKGASGDPKKEHKNFGNRFAPLPGMLLRHSGIVGTVVQPGTKAWIAFEEILALKIKNKDASKINISDYEYMKKIDSQATPSVSKPKTP